MAPNPNDAILKYLRQQNRPYSAVDILNNMHKEFGKTQIQKSLDQLTEEGKIREKANGKQKVYCIVQSNINNDEMKKELQNIEVQCGEATIKLGQVEQNIRTLENKLREYNLLPTTKEANLELSQREDKVVILRGKLENLSTSTVKISPAEKTNILKDHERLTKEAAKRKRICMDIVDSILEGYPKDKKSLFEEVGMEVD